jgi:formiminotetrahydrofolate cyclodeaminase
VSLETFVAALAERTPAPGGGAGAAAGCALGAALAEMAARFAGRDEDAAHAAALRDTAMRLGEADMTAYAPVLEAQRLPADDPERPARVAAAKSAAAEVPLAIAETSAQAAELARALARAGRPALVGDALAGADLAAGAARAAARLVEINLAGARGDPRVARARAAVARAEG